jgi:acetolactate synthase-1/2/3 large subunit/sulfoacetaldehyde acetyltransferase
MADAYGRVTGRPGVVLAGQSGPGATNLVTGIAQAYLAYSPLVAITGMPSREYLGRDMHQEVDQHALFKPITKRTLDVPTAERIPELIQQALVIANSGRRGPVVVNVPSDLFVQEVEYRSAASFSSIPLEALQVSDEDLRKICALILNSAKPVILAGAGVKWGKGSSEVLRLAEQLQLPITASAGHGDVVPNDHPLFAGQVGPRGNPVASRLTRESDLILALGTRLGFNTTFFRHTDISPTAKIIQVDLEPTALGRYFSIAFGVVGDAGRFAACLRRAIGDIDRGALKWKARNAEFERDIGALWRQREEAGEDTSTPLKPERVFYELRRALPKDVIITLDGGTLCRQATDQLKYRESPGLITPLDFGLVGLAYAAGLGAKVAVPARTVVSISGDGGFGMTMAEVGTAVLHGINTVAIVFDNECWGAEKAYQRDFYNGRYIGSDIISPAFDVVAKSCGAKGYKVTRAGELADAVSQAIVDDVPAVISVKMDPNALTPFRKDVVKHKEKS